MTEQHTPEDWKLLTAEALIERCVLYIQRIAELQREKAIANELLGSAQQQCKELQAQVAELTDYKAITEPMVAELQVRLDAALARIAELEAQVQVAGTNARIANAAFTNSIEHVMHQRDLHIERVAELQAQLQAAQQWQPAPDGEIKCVCTEKDCGTVLAVDSVGSHITISRDNDELLMWLPDDIRLCRKVQSTK